MTLRKRWPLMALGAVLAAAAGAAVAVSLRAEVDRAIGGGAPAPGRFTIVSSPLGDRRAGVFVMDAQTMRLLVYSVSLDTWQMKLVAVRDVSEDVRLSHWNNERPWPEEIRQRLEKGDGGG